MVVKSIIFIERKRLFLKYLWHRNYLFSKERWELAGVPLFLCSIQYNNNNYNSHLCGSKLKLQMEKIPFWCPLNFWSKQQVLRTHFSLSSSATLCVILVKNFYHNAMLLFITNNQASKQSNHHHITWNKTKNNCFKGSQKISISKMNKTSVLYVSLRPLTPELSRHLHTKLFVSRKGIFANRCRC